MGKIIFKGKEAFDPIVAEAPTARADKEGFVEITLRVMPMISWIPTAVLLVALLLTAGQQTRAAEPQVITMSCDGTYADTMNREQQESVQKMGLVVNLDERTVSFVGYVARIDQVDAANIHFGGEQIGGRNVGLSIGMMGDVDRVTGHMKATIITSDPKKQPDPNPVVSTFDVLCKAANRVF
jgi:hypothetical protein